MAALGRKPIAIVVDDALPFGLRLVERHEPHRDLLVVGHGLEHVLEIVEVLDRRAAQARHDAAARNSGFAEHIARIRDVNARHGPVEVPAC